MELACVPSCFIPISDLHPGLYDHYLALARREPRQRIVQDLCLGSNILLGPSSHVLSLYAQSLCIDSTRFNHPDIPAELLNLPRKKKSDHRQKNAPRTARGSQDSESSSNAPSVTPSPFRPQYQSYTSPLPQGQWHNAAPRPFIPVTTTIITAQNQSSARSGPFSWRLQNSTRSKTESSPPPQRTRSVLQSRRKVPEPLRNSALTTVRTSEIHNGYDNRDSRLEPSFLAAEYPQLSPYKTNSSDHSNHSNAPSVPASIAASAPPHYQQDDVLPRSVSQPTTPSWLSRGHRAAEATQTHLRLQSISSMASVPPFIQEPFDQKEDFALFVAATSGLSPDQGGMRHSFVSAISEYPSGHATTGLSPGGVSPGGVSPIVSSPVEELSPVNETPNTIRALTSLASLPRSATDLSVHSGSAIISPANTVRSHSRPRQSSNPRSMNSARRPSMNSRSSSYTRSIPSMPSSGSIRPDLPRQHQRHDSSQQSISTLGQPSPRFLRDDASAISTSPQPSPGLPPSPAYQAHPTGLNSNPPFQRPLSREATANRNTFLIPGPVPRPWTNHDNVSSLSVTSDVSRISRTDPWAMRNGGSRNGREEDEDDIEDGAISPVGPEEEEEDLPDYVSSQAQMARARQVESARRAEELNRRWMQSR